MMPFPGERKLQLTEAGKTRLDRAVREYVDRIEALLLERNFIPGESVVEATASDVEEATRRLITVRRTASPLRRVFLRLYTIVGLGMVAAGFFWPQIKDIQGREPSQFMLIVGGFGILLLSLLMTTVFDTRNEYVRRELSLAPDLEREIIRQVRRRETAQRSRASELEVATLPESPQSPSSQESH